MGKVGRFGIFGGQYVPETVMNAVHELEEAYAKYGNDPEFLEEYRTLLRDYAGRPSMLYYADRMTKDLGGCKIYLKREDLNHTGAHKINNVLGQILLAKKMGKSGSLPKPVPDSTAWQLQLLVQCLIWNARSIWAKRTFAVSG